MTQKTYLLMSADRPLIEFIPGKTKIVQIFENNSNLFPPLWGTSPTDLQLSSWLNSRISPLGRRLLNKLAQPCTGPLGVLEATLGLSLNDVWWISDGIQQWKDVNLYENDFDQNVARVAFRDEPISELAAATRSPEWSTAGEMAKCWFRHDGKLFLMKRDDPDGDGLCQTVKEWFAMQAAEAMGLECVKYDLHLLHERLDMPVCECESFTDINTGFMTAAVFLISRRAWLGSVDALMAPREHDDIAKAMGVEFYEDMMVFDSLIGNTDRHLGNFGMLYDNATGEILRPAPLFDHGASFDIGDCRWLSRQLQMETFVRPRHEPMLEAAARLELQPHPEVHVAKKSIEMMQNYVRMAAENALNLLNRQETGLRPE